MKKLFFFLLLPVFCKAQFHVRVEANPDNHGEVNASWKNNYVVTYTLDNWKMGDIIKAEATYEDMYGTPTNSYYQNATFQTKAEAIVWAKKFKTLDIINRFEFEQIKRNKELSKLYKSKEKKPVPEKPNERPQPVAIY